MPIDDASNNKVNDAIMRLYLYGDGADAILPKNGSSNFVSEAAIRPDNKKTTFKIGAQTYKDGPGRFAMPELFEFVRLFFEGALNGVPGTRMEFRGEFRGHNTN